MHPLLPVLIELLGPGNVLTNDDATPYLTDWRRFCTGRALAVVRPANTQQVAEIVQLCSQAGVPIVPQGGNTGQVAAATPDDTGTAILINMQRLNGIRAIDTDNDTITVEAGCVLQTVQEAAKSANRLFPLSLGAEGSCFIGGNLATNAGGTQVLRYGNARELTLGLEVVTAEGAVWNGLRGLRKDNTGYDLRDLYIGSEGTLGIITAATLKLFPLPNAQRTSLLALGSLDDAAAVLRLARSHLGASLTGFEVMSRECMDLVVQTYAQQHLPFTNAPEGVQWYGLLELSDSEDEAHATLRFESVLEAAMENGCLIDAAISSSQAQSDAFWHLRESITLALAENGYCIKHDISLPVSIIPAFVKSTNIEIQKQYPGARMMVFGHLGDGNLHYNLLGPENADRQSVAGRENDIQALVHDRVVAAGGSISAEQGIGSRRVDDLARYKDPVELALMHRIKHALDPKNIMNPGKVLGLSAAHSSTR